MRKWITQQKAKGLKMTMQGIQAVYLPEHNEEPRILFSPADVDDMIDTLLMSDGSGDSVEMFSLDRPRVGPLNMPDHRLFAGVRRDRNAGVLDSGDGTCEIPDTRSASEDVRVSASAVTFATATEGDVVVYSQNGSPFEFLISSEISIGKVREAVKGFVAMGGKRPSCVEWVDAGY
ncbi:Imm1 family immunity protein [Streptomyces anulatus]|uniref:Imm1 family immunity protein n=1 Tax=Streptomyces anulatus TaxID=1892 RepID=UPI0033C77890